VVDDASARIEAKTGFVVSGHQIVFIGRCPDCAAGATVKSGGQSGARAS
jgi:Fe2+ or Zn2+ uptake regulation protein